MRYNTCAWLGTESHTVINCKQIICPRPMHQHPWDHYMPHNKPTPPTGGSNACHTAHQQSCLLPPPHPTPYLLLPCLFLLFLSPSLHCTPHLIHLKDSSQITMPQAHNSTPAHPSPTLANHQPYSRVMRPLTPGTDCPMFSFLQLTWPA